MSFSRMIITVFFHMVVPLLAAEGGSAFEQYGANGWQLLECAPDDLNAHRTPEVVLVRECDEKKIDESAQEDNRTLTPEIKEHIPKGWRFVALAQGNLRTCGAVDVVLVIEKDMEKLDDTVSDDEEKNLPEIPRRLIVLFKEESGFKVYFNSEVLLPAYPNIENTDDFFRSIDIKKGCLKIVTGYIPTLGSWWCSLHEHVFRFEEESKRFRLIGSTHELFHKAYGDAEERSVNYLTHKMKITKVDSVFDDPPSKPKVTWSEYPGVWYMDDIHDLNAFGEQFD